jgi:hypothetical protein
VPWIEHFHCNQKPSIQFAVAPTIPNILASPVVDNDMKIAAVWKAVVWRMIILTYVTLSKCAPDGHHTLPIEDFRGIT